LHRGASLLELRLRGLQILVRDRDLIFERVELRVAVNFPPLAFRERVVRLGNFETRAGGFLIRGRHIGRRADVIRTYGAAAERKPQCEQGCRAADHSVQTGL